MKPLVYWCRWQEARLRLFGRSESAVWGELAFKERTEPFRFELKEWILTIGEGEETRTMTLDEMGVEVNG
jgi:hypothetical protein